MKRNLKITISALAVMLVMALTVTVLSFSFADGKKDHGTFEDKQFMIADSSDMYTNIDNIIENSYATGTDANPIYSIVEIGSAKDKESTLSTYVSGGNFEQYVINGHKFKTDKEMNPNNVEYNYFWVGDVTDLNEEALEIISNADFVYVSNDSTSEYSPENDLCEELYNILHTYAVGSYKPLVIDKPSATTTDDPSGGGTTGGGTTVSGKTIGYLAGDLFDRMGKRYYTFGWDKTAQTDILDFFKMKNGSSYLGINGKNQKKSGKWRTIVEGEGSGTVASYNVSRFLTITDGTDKTMTDLVFAGLTPVDISSTTLKNQDGSPLASDLKLYDVRGALVDEAYQGTLITNNIYNKKYDIPQYVEHTTVNIADLDAAGNTIVLEDYDFIIIEKGCGGTEISDGLYNTIAATMYGSVSMIYDKSMSTTTSGSGSSTGGTTGSGTTVKNESNYLELYYMVSSNDDMAKYQNIKITTKAEFSVITSSKGIAPAKVIADLINASAYRGIGGPAATSNMFTVLEIQPCYPIDEELALEIGANTTKTQHFRDTKFFGTGNYYTAPDQVVNGKTKEQIEDGTEYYAWELSKAKIADVTGLSVNQINLVQMSSEELASSKTDILGEYDLIYVGGNHSALKDITQYRSFNAVVANGDSIGESVTDPEDFKKLPIYATYSHTGDFVRPMIAVSGGIINAPANKNTPGSYINVDTNKDGVTDSTITGTFQVLNGNDITYNNYLADRKSVV